MASSESISTQSSSSTPSNIAGQHEDILLLVPNVVHKKIEGKLFVMGERVAWMPNSKETFSISRYYADTKTQKISPEHRAKVQLQLVPHIGDSVIFNFVNLDSREEQIKDRDAVKELLVQLLPKFRQKVDMELEAKAKAFEVNKDLYNLYKELVVGNVITADEFWRTQGDLKKYTEPKELVQNVGVSSSFLAGIKAETDGCNELKYNLTFDVIESIFKAYPAVAEKHTKLVPEKMNDAEFWTRFFQSHYYHKDRLNTGSKDVFTDCANTDEIEIENEVSKGIDDPLLNLEIFADTSLEDMYSSEASSKSEKLNPHNLSMIRRFNHQGMKILKSSGLLKDTHDPKLENKVKSTADGKRKGKEAVKGEPSLSKKSKLLEKTEYEDLSGTDLHEKDDTSQPPAELVARQSKADIYLRGPLPSTSQTQKQTSSADMFLASRALKEEVMSSGSQPDLTNAVKSSVALTVISEFTPGGVLLKDAQQLCIDQTIPKALLNELQVLHKSLSELLRHFWACFPVTNTKLQEKLVQMKGILERFQMVKIRAFQDKVSKHSEPTSKMANNLNIMVAAALNRFKAWEEKKKSTQFRLK